jgi:Fe-S-cluster formation regulator IscX/YfhJ
MKFIPIFTNAETCDLWSTCYPEHEVDNISKDIYSILMDERWSDDKFLFDSIKHEEDSFNDTYWKGVSFSQIIKNIKIELNSFDQELYEADENNHNSKSRSLDKIFLKLHDNIYSLNTFNDSFRKGKPDFKRAIIRLYGIELEDKTIIITGGTLKFKQKMIGKNFDLEMNNLKRVQKFLNQESIIDRKGLLD